MSNHLIAQLRHCLTSYPIEQAFLFGSHARGSVTPLSDIDIAVKYQPNIDKEAIESRLFADLSLQFHTDAIDIIDLDEASPLLAHRAVLQGKPILDQVAHDEAILKTIILHRYEETRHLRDIKQVVFV